MRKAERKKRYWERVIMVGGVIIMATAAVKAFDRHSADFHEPVDLSACPGDMVLIATGDRDICLDRYEASAGPACRAAAPSSQGETRTNLADPACRPVSVSGRVPWRYISQDQAALACAKAGKRLPTPKEWYLAALGTPDKAGDWGPDDCQVASNWPDQPGAAGSGRECVSGAGAYDMVGNVWEWVEGTIEDGRYNGSGVPSAGYVAGLGADSLPAATDPSAPAADYFADYFWIKSQGARGVARGGYWDNQGDAGQYAVYAVTAPNSAAAGIGFRCAASPRP